jgi:hypothetical protein
MWGLKQLGPTLRQISALISLKRAVEFAICKTFCALKITACAGAQLFNPGTVGKKCAKFISIKNYTDIKDRYIPSADFCVCINVHFGFI